MPTTPFGLIAPGWPDRVGDTTAFSQNAPPIALTFNSQPITLGNQFITKAN